MPARIFAATALGLVLGAAFWTVDWALLKSLPAGSMSSIVIRNVVLIVVCAGLYAMACRRIGNLNIQALLLSCLLCLWLGGVAAIYFSPIESAAPAPGIGALILAFPLVTLSYATYVGILPALLIVSVALFVIPKKQ